MIADPLPVARAARSRVRMAEHPGRALRDSRSRRGAGGDLPARSAAFPGGLSVRRTPRAPDARHAADPAAAPHGRKAGRVRRQRLRTGRVGHRRHGGAGARRPPRHRRPVCRGHAGRRSRCLARRVEPHEAHVPPQCRHLRADRAAPSRQGCKSGRQVTISSDLIYDVLRKHDPGHILLEAAWADAATGLLDIARLGDFLRRIKGKSATRRWTG